MNRLILVTGFGIKPVNLLHHQKEGTVYEYRGNGSVENNRVNNIIICIGTLIFILNYGLP